MLGPGASGAPARNAFGRVGALGSNSGFEFGLANEKRRGPVAQIADGSLFLRGAVAFAAGRNLAVARGDVSRPVRCRGPLGRGDPRIAGGMLVGFRRAKNFAAPDQKR